MAVSSSSTREFSVQDIVTSSAQRAGIMGIDASQSGPQFAAMLAFGMRELDILMDQLQGEVTLTRAVDRYPITTVIGTASYALPSTTVEVMGWASYAEGSATTSTPLRGILRDEYMVIADKTVQGRPTLFFPEYSASGITVQLWPVPSAVGVVTFQRYRLLSDSNSSTATLDLERHWIDHISWSLAHLFACASSLSTDTCGYLGSRAEKALKAAKRMTAQRWPSEMRMNFRSGAQR